jgi:hypothetical protein
MGGAAASSAFSGWWRDRRPVGFCEGRGLPGGGPISVLGGLDRLRRNRRGALPSGLSHGSVGLDQRRTRGLGYTFPRTIGFVDLRADVT